MPRYNQVSHPTTYPAPRSRVSPASRLETLCTEHAPIAEAVEALKQAHQKSKGALQILRDGKPAVFSGVAEAQEHLKTLLRTHQVPRHFIYPMVQGVTTESAIARAS